MSYIQNKLDEFENKFTDTELGNFYSTVTTWKHTIGMPVHVKMFIEQALTEAYNKGQTDYHNHIAKHLRCCDCEGSGAYQSPSDYSPCKNCDGTGLRPDGSLNDLLQDTNPKE